MSVSDNKTEEQETAHEGHETAAQARNDQIQTPGGDLMAQVRRYVPVVGAFARQNSIALIAGIFGSLAAVILTITFRLTWGSPTLPEFVGERILPTMKATDGTGTVQTMTQHGTVPDGATGWGIVSVDVTTTK